MSIETSPLQYLRMKIGKAESEITIFLKKANREADLVRLGFDILRLCDDVAAQLQQISPSKALACREGCDLCCRNLIQINPIFAVVALQEARRSFDEEQFEVLKERLVSDTPHCPFLFDGRCSIYSVRPLVCRGYYNLDFELCKIGDYYEKDSGYQGQDGHAAHQLMIFLFVLENRIETIEKSLGLDTGPVFLNVAVRTLLERPETVEAWLSGQKIFPGVSGNEVVDSANAVKTA